jgi:hypothetical protein
VTALASPSAGALAVGLSAGVLALSIASGVAR